MVLAIFLTIESFRETRFNRFYAFICLFPLIRDHIGITDPKNDCHHAYFPGANRSLPEYYINVSICTYHVLGNFVCLGLVLNVLKCYTIHICTIFILAIDKNI